MAAYLGGATVPRLAAKSPYPGGGPQEFTLQKVVFATRRNVQEEERNVSGEPINPHFVSFAFLILILLKTV